MRVILRSDVDGVGKRGDIVDVANGFGRNFLVPRGLAMKATTGAEGQAASMRRSRTVRDARDREAAEEVATRLVPQVITVTARAGEGGRLFGSVTPSDVTAAVLAQTGIDIDRRQLHLEDHIKALGTHHVTARLHTDVQFPITVEVVSDRP